MLTLQDQLVTEEICPKRLGAKERLSIFSSKRNEFLEDTEFLNCEFHASYLTTHGKPHHRSHARRVRLQNCRMTTFAGEGAIFDEVIVENLVTVRHPAFFFACAFRHVKLRGKCGRFLFRPHLIDDDEGRNAAFIEANSNFYQHIDWALDITELQSSCLELQASVPVRLIRRNPEQQFIMNRDVALGDEWRNYEPLTHFSWAYTGFVNLRNQPNCS